MSQKIFHIRLTTNKIGSNAKSMLNSVKISIHCFPAYINWYKSHKFTSMKKFIPLEEGDFYLSEEGYKVFTKQYHLKRGYCCESGCRHCPYGYNQKTNAQRHN